MSSHALPRRSCGERGARGHAGAGHPERRGGRTEGAPRRRVKAPAGRILRSQNVGAPAPPGQGAGGALAGAGGLPRRSLSRQRAPRADAAPPRGRGRAGRWRRGRRRGWRQTQLPPRLLLRPAAAGLPPQPPPPIFDSSLRRCCGPGARRDAGVVSGGRSRTAPRAPPVPQPLGHRRCAARQPARSHAQDRGGVRHARSRKMGQVPSCRVAQRPAAARGAAARGGKRTTAPGPAQGPRGNPCAPCRAGAPAAPSARAIAPQAADRATAAPQKISRAFASARRWRAFQCPICPKHTGGYPGLSCFQLRSCACLRLPCHHCPEPALLVYLPAPASRGRRAGCGRPLQDRHPPRRGRAGGRAAAPRAPEARRAGARRGAPRGHRLRLSPHGRRRRRPLTSRARSPPSSSRHRNGQYPSLLGVRGLLGEPPPLQPDRGEPVDRIAPLGHLPEHRVLPVEPRRVA